MSRRIGNKKRKAGERSLKIPIENQNRLSGFHKRNKCHQLVLIQEEISECTMVSKKGNT